MLLICRELSLGDQRFTDLRRALAGIAPNLLSERLRKLQATGLVESVDLPAPAARSVYRLTGAGRHVLPMLRAAARFGAQYLGDVPPDVQFSARRAASAFLLPWWRSVPSRAPALVRLRLDGSQAVAGDELVDIDLDDGVRLLEPDGTGGAGRTPDVFVEATMEQLVAARRPDGRFGATVRGSSPSRATFFQAFDLRPAVRRRANVASSAGR